MHPAITCLSILMFCTVFADRVTAQSLEQAVSLALMTNPRIHQQTQHVQTRMYEETIAKAGYLPTVQLHGGSGFEWTSNPTIWTGSPTSSDRLHRYESSVALRQELFSGFSTRNEAQKARSATRSEQFRLINVASEMALGVARSYISIIMTRRAFELAEKNLQVHKDIFQRVLKRAESGIQSTSDLSLVSGRLASAEASTIACKNNLTDAGLRFQRLTGVRPEELTEPVPDRSLIPDTLQQVLKLAENQYPLLKSACEDSVAAHSDYKASKSRFLPEVYFSAERSWNKNINGIVGRNDDYTLMFHVRYNLFNGGGDKARVQASLSRWHESLDVFQQALREVQEEAGLAWEAHIELHHQLPQLERHVTYSIETVNAYRRQYALGERSLLDVLNAENESLSAALNWNSAHIASLDSDYRLLHICGQLLDALRITLPPDWTPEHLR